MKMFTKLNVFVVLMLLSLSVATAQVTFTNRGDLMATVSGFGYEDCVVDMNGDYLDDIVRVGNSGIDIDYQKLDGTFDHVKIEMTFQNLPGWSMCAGDIDNNGLNDLLFGSGDRVSFIYANADGTAYTEDFHEEYIFSQRSTFADIDNDGNLDAFVCHDVDQSHPYRNDGAGNLVEDQMLIVTADMPGNYAAIWVDYDNDWDTDLYITKCRQGSSSGDPTRTNQMYRNNGDGTYTEVAAAIGLADNAQSWATVFEDFDNDGDFDAFIVNHDFQNRFYINNGDGTFTDTINITGIAPNDLGAWENASGDFNNDGFVDIFSELNRELYLNNGDMTFTGYDLPFNDGGIGDLNNDGFLDVVSGSNLWMNDGNDNNWLKINTLGIVSNRNGIGARVEIYGEWGMQVREVRSGQSFSPMSSLCVHFGLGQATAIDSLVVKWPSGMKTKLDNPAINTVHDIVEADCLLDETVLEVTTTEICPGTTATITAPEGFAYDWSNDATTASIEVSEAGTYSAILTAADGCISLSTSVVISIIEDETPHIEIDGKEIFCQGESVTLTASNGMNFNWTNGMSDQSIEVTETGEYMVMIDAMCSEEQLSSEVVSITVLDAPEPALESIDAQEDGSYLLNAMGNNLEWYDAAEGGALVGEGATLQTPVLEEDTYYYAEAHSIYGGGLGEGGKPDFQGAGGLPASGGQSYFDAYEPFTILTVLLSVPAQAGPGERTIQLVDANNQVLAQTVVNLTTGSHTVPLNFEVPVGTGLSLRCPEHNLFRNSGGVQYPYPIDDVGLITTSEFGGQYYYYFYDWQIEKAKIECISERVEIAVLAVGIEELGDVSDLSIFPNPATERLTIQLEAASRDDLIIRLLDVTGKEVLVQQENLAVGQNQMNLNVADLAAGFYQVQLLMNGKMVTEKVVID